MWKHARRWWGWARGWGGTARSGGGRLGTKNSRYHTQLSYPDIAHFAQRRILSTESINYSRDRDLDFIYTNFRGVTIEKLFRKMSDILKQFRAARALF